MSGNPSPSPLTAGQPDSMHPDDFHHLGLSGEDHKSSDIPLLEANREPKSYPRSGSFVHIDHPRVIPEDFYRPLHHKRPSRGSFNVSAQSIPQYGCMPVALNYSSELVPDPSPYNTSTHILTDLGPLAYSDTYPTSLQRSSIHRSTVSHHGSRPPDLVRTPREVPNHHSINRRNSNASGVKSRAESLRSMEEEKQNENDETPQSKRALLAVYTLGMLASSVINSLYFKKMTSAMPNYSAFLNQATSVIYIPLFSCVCLYLYLSFGANGLGGERVVSFPLYKFTVMGILDAVGSVFMVIGGTYTTGATQVVLSQTVIPVTLITCYLGLARRYHPFQYIGALVIMIGVAVTKFKSHADQGGSIDTADKLPYNLVFMAATVPLAFSTLYKELAFNDIEMNVNYMQFWVALWQFIIGFCLVPMQSLPMLGPQRVPLSEMTESMKDGLLCLVTGRNFVVTNCGGPDQPHCDNCGSAWLPVANYCLVNIAYNIFTLLVVKHGGATISFLVSTLRLPLTTICFSSAWVMGAGSTTTPTLYDYLGLGVLFMGLCSYRYGSLLKAKTLPAGMKQVHFYTTTLDADPIIVSVPKATKKTAMQLRNQLYHRLSVGHPLLNPETRALYDRYTPPKIPEELSDFLPYSLLQRYNKPPPVPTPVGSGAWLGASSWDPYLGKHTDVDSVCSSRSRDPLSEVASIGGSQPRQSQRQRWLRTLASKYGTILGSGQGPTPAPAPLNQSRYDETFRLDALQPLLMDPRTGHTGSSDADRYHSNALVTSTTPTSTTTTTTTNRNLISNGDHRNPSYNGNRL